MIKDIVFALAVFLAYWYLAGAVVDTNRKMTKLLDTMIDLLSKLSESDKGEQK